MAKFDTKTTERWDQKAQAWLDANANGLTRLTLAEIMTGIDAWTVAHRSGITQEAYSDRTVTDAHIQTALERIFPNAQFKDVKRY